VRGVGRIVGRTLATAWLALGAGCGTNGREGDAASGGGAGGATPEVNLVFDSRINWVSGDVLVMPLNAATVASDTPRVFVLEGDQAGEALAARIAFLTVTVPAEDHSAAEWLDAPGVWASAETGAGTRVIVVEAGELGGGGDLVVGGRRFSVNWLPLPRTLVRAAPDSPEQPWLSPISPSIRRSPLFLALTERERLNPLTRWRYRLIVDGLDPAAEESGVPFADRTIEAVARQNENRWRVALAWLWAADPAVADSLKKRLVACVTLPDGITVPAWPTAHTSLDDLLSGLLDPASTPNARVRRAERWLQEQSAATAWVMDDGGRLDALRGVVASLGIANLSERATLGWAGVQDSDIEPEPVPLAAFHAVEVAVPIRDSGGGLAAIELHAGEWEQIRGVIPGRIGIRPPGLDVSSLLGDWTMRDWLNGTPRRPAPAWNTRARLARIPGGYGWRLTVECDGAGTVGDRERERLSVLAGPNAEEATLIVVSPGSSGERVRTGSDAMGWNATIEIPPEAVEADGTLRLALHRVDARGRRSAWPRSMFPWQTSPARAALNLNAWDGFQSGGGAGAGTTSGR